MDDDISKLLRCHKTAVHLAGVLFLLRIRKRHGADGSRRSLYILLLDGRRDICHGKPKLCQPVGIQPDAHGIIRTENLHITDA